MLDQSAALVTIGESAYRRIRHDIIFGRLAPSHKLKLDTLRTSYGVSVSTLREILNRLCSEGFIVAGSPPKGSGKWPECASCWSVMRSRRRLPPATSNGRAA